MGSKQSHEAADKHVPAAASADLRQILEENTHYPGTHSKYPYVIIQLSEEEELEYQGMLVSDAICEFIRENRVTHLIAQTHGWNTPPDKAVAVSFTEFMSGMQNDDAMPTDDFHPLFVAFIWPAVPIEFVRSEDALTRAELLAKNEEEHAGADTDIAKAARAAKKAIEDDDADEEELVFGFKKLAAHSHGPDDDDDDDNDDDDSRVERLREEGKERAARKAEAEEQEEEEEERGKYGFLDGLRGVALKVFKPLETLVFGRLTVRGQRTGKVMERVLGKLMQEKESERMKVCLMANSLGAHVLAGIMKNPSTLPYKLHTVFFVQGAIPQEVFESGRKYDDVTRQVAGPVVCTYSARDLLLKNIFELFYGTAIGLEGVMVGRKLMMKGIQEMREDPYELSCGDWNSVNGIRFISEGDPIAGGHGDFKDDETTSLYWSAIKTEVPDHKYER